MTWSDLADHPLAFAGRLAHAVGHFLPHPILPLLGVFAIQLVLLTWLESRQGVYPRPRFGVFLRDLAITLYVFLLVVPLWDHFNGPLQFWLPMPGAWSRQPLLLRFGVYLVAADLGNYLMHRLTHTPWLWRVHRWHHSFDHMGFLAGTRVSLIDRVMVTIPYLLLTPLLLPAPQWLFVLNLLFAWARNDWMHLNVGWGPRWLEQVVVTPRYHHLHHSVDKAHHDRNFGVFFSCWDRLFGTYVDPAPHVGKLRFGIPEQVPPARLVVGL